MNLESEKKNAESRPCGCRVGVGFWTVAESVDLHSWQCVNPRVGIGQTQWDQRLRLKLQGREGLENDTVGVKLESDRR